MVNKWLAKFKGTLGEIRDFVDEKTFASANCGPLSRVQRFAHFWLVVAKNFSRTRCPVHASALAYTSLLALIPMLFVVVSVSTSVLKQEGGARINQFIDKFLASMTPPSISTNSPPIDPDDATFNAATSAAANSETNALPVDSKSFSGREQIIQNINESIGRIQSGTLGVTGLVILVWLAISMLSSIEATFNDIWGVPRGRSWLVRIEKYGAVLFLGPVLLGLALGLSSAPYFDSTREMLHSSWIFKLGPVAVLCITFGLFYLLMPNTHVHWDAALVGGLVGGILWHLNNYFSVLYVSRWVTNSKIYGSLAVIPVFMVGLYFSWLIVLFGAQVAYAYQHRARYLQEKQAENINQRGREFIALRLMECVGQRFQRGKPPATIEEMAEGLAVPSRLVLQIMHTLLAARLVVEVAGVEPAYAPARPLGNITCHDILLALRAGQGQELVTRDEPARAEVFGEFERILAAEKAAASSVTILAMVDRTEKLAATSSPTKAVTDAKQQNDNAAV